MRQSRLQMLGADDSGPRRDLLVTSPPCDRDFHESESQGAEVTARDPRARRVSKSGKAARKIYIGDSPPAAHETVQQPARRAAEHTLNTPWHAGNTAHRMQEARRQNGPEHCVYP